MKKAKVLIYVLGGIAQIVAHPKNVEVDLRDGDNFKDAGNELENGGASGTQMERLEAEVRDNKPFTRKEIKEARQSGEKRVFPNGFTNWVETHHEIVQEISMRLSTDKTHVRADSPSKIVREYRDGGTGRMYEIAEDLTDKFEKKNKGREWDGEFFDEIEGFMKKYDESND